MYAGNAAVSLQAVMLGCCAGPRRQNHLTAGAGQLPKMGSLQASSCLPAVQGNWPCGTVVCAGNQSWDSGQCCSLTSQLCRAIALAAKVVAQAAGAGQLPRLGDLLVEGTWRQQLETELSDKIYFRHLQKYLHAEWVKQKIFPPKPLIFRQDVFQPYASPVTVCEAVHPVSLGKREPFSCEAAGACLQPDHRTFHWASTPVKLLHAQRLPWLLPCLTELASAGAAPI